MHRLLCFLTQFTWFWNYLLPDILLTGGPFTDKHLSFVEKSQLIHETYADLRSDLRLQTQTFTVCNMIYPHDGFACLQTNIQFWSANALRWREFVILSCMFLRSIKCQERVDWICHLASCITTHSIQPGEFKQIHHQWCPTESSTTWGPLMLLWLCGKLMIWFAWCMESTLLLEPKYFLQDQKMLHSTKHLYVE